MEQQNWDFFEFYKNLEIDPVVFEKCLKNDFEINLRTAGNYICGIHLIFEDNISEM